MSRIQAVQATRNWWQRLALRLLRVMATLLLALLALILLFRWVPPPFSAVMLWRQAGTLFSQDAPPLHYEWMSLDELSPHAAVAVIAAEDQLFLDHWGFDLKSIGKAMDSNGRGRKVRGASTISQQVAKNLFLWSGRSWLRKGLEAGITLLLESLWPKRRILEVYLNIAQFGDGVYGVSAASRHLLKADPRRLSRAQAARLAAVLPSPRRFNAANPSPYVRQRAVWIQSQMRQLGGSTLLRELPR